VLARRKRLNLQQPLSRLLKLKEMNPILKALLKFLNTKNLFKLWILQKLRFVTSALNNNCILLKKV